jgi:hypothetical protein
MASSATPAPKLKAEVGFQAERKEVHAFSGGPLRLQPSFLLASLIMLGTGD